MDEKESIYGPYRPDLEKIQKELLDDIDKLRNELKEKHGMDPVEHCLSRIKSEDSMREKCVRKGLPVTTESALTKIYDAIGIRVVCSFLDDVYKFHDYLVAIPGAEVIEEKDYIKHAKPNGYRSYHMILRMHGKFYAEIQLRTISQDTWAALEHHIKYKHDLGRANEDLVVSELKRCADELASTDLTMQTRRDTISEENNVESETA